MAVPNTETRNKRELKRNYFHVKTGTDFCLRSYSEHHRQRQQHSACCVSNTFAAVCYILRLWCQNSGFKHF